MMGLIDLPYHACQVVIWAKSVVLGDRLTLKNNFVWERVAVKLPGTTAY